MKKLYTVDKNNNRGCMDIDIPITAPPPKKKNSCLGVRGMWYTCRSYEIDIRFDLDIDMTLFWEYNESCRIYQFFWTGTRKEIRDCMYALVCLKKKSYLPTYQYMIRPIYMF